MADPTTTSRPITRDDLEDKFRELEGGARDQVASARSTAITAGVVVFVAVGSALGSLNGACVTRFNMPPFIVTLTTMMFFSGLAIWITTLLKPDGSSNGFGRRVPETYVRDDATKALAAEAARALAEDHARTDWNVDLAPFRLLEQSQQTRASGRVDHVFVY